MKEERIFPPPNQRRGDRWQQRRLHAGNLTLYFLLIAISIILIAVPASAGAGPEVTVQPAATGPQEVDVAAYIVDFSRFDVTAGTVGVDYYLTLRSDSPVSIDDIELMNGMITSVTPVMETPREKSTGLLQS